MVSPPSKRVAIVGSGAGGMGALYALRNTNHEVHLFEADSRLGGHTNTVKYTKDGQSANVDTGFFVLNTATYPNFIAMLDHLKVKAVDTSMTFSVSRDQGLYEWAGTNLSSVFAQRKNKLNPRTWRMLLDIIRFNLTAIELLAQESEATGSPSKFTDDSSAAPPLQETLGSYLARKKYSDPFIDDYLLPMTAAVWSTPPDKCALEFPAVTLIRFMWNHHLLSTFSARPPWLTIRGGSSTYIQAILDYFPAAKIHLNTPVEAVAPKAGGKVLVDFGPNGMQEFDHVILATHGDQSRRILGVCATKEERQILDAFTTTKNEAVLHGDTNLMPKRPEAHAAWNILSLSGKARQRRPNGAPQAMAGHSDQVVALTYNMTLLQHLPKSLGLVMVTLNPPFPPAKELTQASFVYEHPLYTPASIHAQSLLPSIQHKRGISYAGAWTRYGFHEDGFSSGVKVAMDALGGSMGNTDWVDATFVRGKDEGGIKARIKRKIGLAILMAIELSIWWLWLPWVISVFMLGVLLKLTARVPNLVGIGRQRLKKRV